MKDKSICLSCYWAYPENYEHIAMRQVRRLDLLWESDDIEMYEKLKQRAASLDKEIPMFVKEMIEREIERHSSD